MAEEEVSRKEEEVSRKEEGGVRRKELTLEADFTLGPDQVNTRKFFLNLSLTKMTRRMLRAWTSRMGGQRTP